MQKTVAEIAAILGGKVEGDGSLVISGLNGFELARTGELTFAEAAKYLDKLELSQASCFLVAEAADVKTTKTLIRVRSPKEGFFILLNMIYRPDRKSPGVHPSAVIHPSAVLGKDIYVGPFVVIDEGAKLGDKAQIGAQCFVGRNVEIGAGTQLYPRVTLYYESKVGSRVIIHSGAVIGADGFGYFEKDGVHHKIPQTGNVIIEDDVELGANVTVDRATFGSTVIGRGSKLDNMVHVAHNCQVGRNVIMCGQSGVAGSTVIEDNVMVGAQAGIKDHVRLKKRSLIGATAAVKEGTEEGQYVLGMPAVDAMEFGRRHSALGQLTRKLKTLMRMLREYEAKNEK